jgi:histone H3/H4
MRRSRSLTFKKEQEQEPQRQQPPKLKSPPPQLSRPQQTKINYQSHPQSHEVDDSEEEEVPLTKLSNRTIKPQPSKKQPSKYHEQEEEEEEVEEHYDSHEEEEEEVVPVPSVKARPSTAKPKQSINLSSEVEEKSSRPRGRSPGRPPSSASSSVVKSSPKSKPQEIEEEHEVEEEEEKDTKESGEKRKRLILSKTLFQKLLSRCEIESTTSDIIYHTEADLIEYVQDVIKVISNNEEDDEVVVRDSSLKFLGDKSKAQGLLDQKTFDKIFNEAMNGVSTNITFTSEAYKSLCKYTEVHVVDMLTKVKAIMKHSGRKRLNTSDVELLKFILE